MPKTQSYNLSTDQYEPTPSNVAEFLKAIEAVCTQFQLSISHEDTQGGFVIEPLKQDNLEWLNQASVRLD